MQVFDQRKFNKRDQGFLGVVTILIADVINLAVGGTGACAGYHCSYGGF